MWYLFYSIVVAGISFAFTGRIYNQYIYNDVILGALELIQLRLKYCKVTSLKISVY